MPSHLLRKFSRDTNFRWRQFATDKLFLSRQETHEKRHAFLSPRSGCCRELGAVTPCTCVCRAGHMKASKALDLITYLENEKDYLPWKVALSQLQFVLVHIQVGGSLVRSKQTAQACLAHHQFSTFA